MAENRYELNKQLAQMLKWRGAFADVPDMTDVYNYYSDGDEVFEEQSEVPTKYSRIFHWPTFKSSWPFVETSGMLTPATSAIMTLLTM